MLRIFDILGFTIERLRLHRILVFWVLIGLSSATTLALSIVLYVDSVNTRLLDSSLDDPPYGFRFRYLGSWEGNIGRDDLLSADASITQGFRETIGLPIAKEVRFIRSLPWRLNLTSEEGTAIPLQPANTGILEGVEDQIRITAGEWPPQNVMEDAIPALLSETMLYNMGIQVGDILTIQQSGIDAVQVKVAAMWQPLNSNDPRWIFTPRFFNEILLFQEDDFWEILTPMDVSIEEGAWYLIFDGTEVRTSDVVAMLGNIADGERNIANVLPGIRMESPREKLQAFVDEVNLLTQQLVIIILPVAGLVLYFVSLVAGLLVSRQRGEDVTLRSRGMSRRILLSIHTVMWLILAGTALGISMIASPYVVYLVGQTTSFLHFDGKGDPLQILFTRQAIFVGIGTALLAASSGLLMAFRSTFQTINSYNRQKVRASKAWWQRMYLDIILLVPGIYVFYSLNQQGGLETEADNPFADPLTFVGPTLFALGMTMLFLRVWPFVIRINGGIIAYTRSIAILMALRELARSIGRYRGTLLMMCFTLSLTGLTASMASTIDSSLEDTVDYRVGADAVMITVADTETEEKKGEDGQPSTFTVTGFNTLPVDDIWTVDGVRAVSRVGKYPSRLLVRNQRIDGVVLGIDRDAIASTTYFREDFAEQYYADLFNLMATNRSGIILNRKVVVDQNILIGDEIDLQVSALGEWHETRVPVLGIVDFFPTLDPTAGFFAITNIQPIFELVGTELPHDVWLGLEPDADLATVQAAIHDLEYPVLEWKDPQTELAKAQAEPSRRGVLGFLSVGFVASIILTLVASIIQNTVSFRAQAIQLGTLRAMGLSGLTSSLYLILVQGIAAASGILAGTSIGVATTLLFLPLLDFSGGLPPYLVHIAWNEIVTVYLIFSGVLFSVTIITALFASLQQLSNIVKIGDV